MTNLVSLSSISDYNIYITNKDMTETVRSHYTITINDCLWKVHLIQIKFIHQMLQSPVLWPCVVVWVHTNILEEQAASTFRVEVNHNWIKIIMHERWPMWMGDRQVQLSSGAQKIHFSKKTLVMAIEWRVTSQMRCMPFLYTAFSGSFKELLRGIHNPFR